MDLQAEEEAQDQQSKLKELSKIAEEEITTIT
jgi:hypothetical protein